MPAFDPINRPVRKNANGGFDILLQKSLTGAAVSETATPPDMLEEDRATRDTGAEDWMSAVGEAARTSGVNVPAGARAQYTPPASAMPPDMGGGPLSKMLPSGMSDTLAGVAGGMNTIDRMQSPLAGFAAGMSGAMTTRENRRESKRKEMMELEDRQLRRDELKYQHGRDEFRDQFLLTAEERAQAAAEREGKSSQRDEALDAMSAQVKALEIKKAGIELERLATQQGFTVDQSQKAMDQAARITEAEYKEVTIDTPELKAEFQASLQRNLQIALQAAGGGGAEAATPAGASIDSPLDWAPGSEPRTDAEFTAAADAAVKANGGKPIIVRDPESKQLRLYRGAAAAM